LVQGNRMDRKIGLFDAMRTMRAMRRLKHDPVPDELIREIIEAGIWAPSGGDSQHWRFIVVKDLQIKKQLQLRYKRAFEDLKQRFHAAPPPPGKTEEQKQRMLAARDHLTEHFHEAPVLIVCCLVGDSGSGSERERRFTPPCKTCCSPRAPWDWARR
jgi:nitroreductase